MKFNDKEDYSILIKENHDIFIYFLIEDGEVVYVGQTRNGFYRPFSHKNKKFNEVKIIYCELENLDALENIYIKKYNPKYNRELNYKTNYTMVRIRNNLEKLLNITIYLTDIKKIIKFLNINFEIDEDLKKPVISSKDFLRIKNFVKIIIKNRISLDRNKNLGITQQEMEEVFNGTKGF